MTKKHIATEVVKSTTSNVTALVIGIISFLSLQLGKEVLSMIHLSQMPSMTNKAWFLLSLLLLALFLLSSFLAFTFYRKTYVKPPSGGYIFQNDPGFYIHKRTGGHYCNPCLAKGYASQLSIHFKDGYLCRTCGEVYIPPDSEDATWQYLVKHGEIPNCH